VHARQTPAGKAELVACLRRDGRRVLAVGDGINDAAMLAAAEAGAAVGGRSDIAALAGGVVLDARRPLAACAEAVALARATRRIMHGNLAGAAVYNLAALPLAMSGGIDPMWAGAAMAASSLTVLANSLRLRLWKP
jgi:Cu+-exporting ATPase